MADKSKWDITNTSALYKLELYVPYGWAEQMGFPTPAGGWLSGDSTEASPPASTPAPVPTPTPAPNPAPGGGDAIPTAAKVFINGKQVAFDAYTIRGSNYFKLRDLAYSLNGTSKQFDIAWDSAANAINLLSNRVYTAVGGEMAPGDGQRRSATLSSSAVLLDGQPITLEAYNIGGNNYFRLRDIGRIFNFATDWDAANNAIKIDTSQPYRD